MKILDRYIVKNFLSTFFFMVLILSSIIVIVDISQKSERISNTDSSVLEALVEFYPYWTVWIVNTFMPVAVFISVIYFTSRLTMKTEFVAALSGGISIYRLTRPYLYVSFGVLLFSLVVNNFALPWSNIKKNEYYYEHMLGTKDRRDYESKRKISAEIANEELIFVQSYDRIKKQGSNFVYQKYDSLDRLEEQYMARSFDWIEADSVYFLKELYYKKPSYSGGIDSLSYKNSDSLRFVATPDDILPEEYVAETMNSIELNDFIESQKFKGSNSVNTYQNEYFSRLSTPFSTVILTIFAFAISSRKRRGGIGINLAIGLVLAFAYIFFGESSKIFSEEQIMSPLMASWLPNICFAIIAGVAYYFRVRD